MTIFRNLLAAVGLVAIAGVVAAIFVIWTGAYDVAADSGQGIIDRIAEITRENSVASRDGNVVVPPLGNPVMIATGAARYNKMCTACHLAPGMADNEMRPGMNPRPPRLAARKHPHAKEDFWIVKHGIKMTAMPAWGATHSDKKLWPIIAFLQQLPGMSAAQYHALVAQGSPATGAAARTGLGGPAPTALPLQLTPPGHAAQAPQDRTYKPGPG